MCGILGAWCDEPLEPAVIDAALNAMRHRGPDDAGKFHHGKVWLAMRRLAIIDLAGGRQPLFNEERTLAVVCNGEIYNYRELSAALTAAGHRFGCQSDTEVLVHLYEEHGTALCRQLRGMYGFAIWDAHRRRLLLGRDRFGKKPLYYARTPSGGLLFASELKALRPLVLAAGGTWELREQAVYDYLSIGCVPQPETAFRGVQAVPPAATLEFDGSSVRIERYWSLCYHEKKSLSYAEALEQTRAHVAEAVHLRLRSDVPLGVFLSGGVDSSVVAYEAAREVGANLQTFTVALDDPGLDESAVAARTARRLGVRNTRLPLTVAPRQMLETLVRQYDQPFADPSAIPSLAISRLARQHVTVVLNGDGGDEVFAGYRRHLAAYLSGRLRFLPASLAAVAGKLLGRSAAHRRSPAGFAARVLRGACSPAGTRYLTWTSDRLHERDKRASWKKLPAPATEAWIESLVPHGLSALDTQLDLDRKINLLSQLLVKMDIATMAHSIEGRSPFLDHKLAEFVAALPDGYRLHRRQPKSLLRDAYRDRLPSEVISGRKRGFEIPLEAWLQTDLREVLHDTVGSSGALVRDWLEGRFIDGILHRSVLAERNWATLTYSLLVLELWLREFRASQLGFSGVRNRAA